MLADSEQLLADLKSKHDKEKHILTEENKKLSSNVDLVSFDKYFFYLGVGVPNHLTNIAIFFGLHIFIYTFLSVLKKSINLVQAFINQS